MNYKVLVAATTLTLLSGTTFAASGFLSDYSKLTPVQSATGTTISYTSRRAHSSAPWITRP